MILFDYKEFGGNPNRSIVEHFNNEPYPEKDAVIKYLRTAGEKKCFCGLVKDIIDSSVHGTSVLLKNEKYSWLSDLIYYVQKYNFKPEEEFIKDIINEV